MVDISKKTGKSKKISSLKKKNNKTIKVGGNNKEDIKENEKIIESFNNENKKDGGAENNPIGYFEPEILRNLTRKDRQELFNSNVRKKEQAQQAYKDAFQRYEQDQKTKIEQQKQDLEKTLHKREEANKKAEADRQRAEERRRYETDKTTGYIYTFVVFVSAFVVYILKKIGQIVIYILAVIGYTLVWFFDKTGRAVKFFWTDGRSAIVYTLNKAFAFLKWSANKLYDFGKWMFNNIGKITNIIINKISSALYAGARIMTEMMKSNGAILRYVCFFVVIILLISWMFGTPLPKMPKMSGPKGMFGDFGYGMFKDKFEYLIGDHFRKAYGTNWFGYMLSDYSYDPSIGGGGIADLLEFNPKIKAIPQFSYDIDNEPVTLFNLHWKVFNFVLPKTLLTNVSVSYNSFRSNMSYIFGGEDPNLANARNNPPRPFYEIGADGRCDNIYNYDVNTCFKGVRTVDNIDQIITEYDNNNKKKIEDSDKIYRELTSDILNLNKSVVSIGKPKDIVVNLTPENYYGIDYNKLTNKIKEYKKEGESLSLKDKTSITIPWVPASEIDSTITVDDTYILNFEKAYYTKGTKDDLISNDATLILNNNPTTGTLNTNIAPTIYNNQDVNCQANICSISI